MPYSCQGTHFDLASPALAFLTCSFIGIACGLLAYHLNYPSVLSHNCGQPKLRNKQEASPVSDERTPALEHGSAWQNAGKGSAASQA
jgi:hypothetical protein